VIGVVIHQPAEVHPRAHLRGQGRLDGAFLDQGYVDIEPDKPAAIDRSTDLGRQEASPREIMKIEKLGTDPDRPETGFTIDGIRLGDARDHHRGGASCHASAYKQERPGTPPGDPAVHDPADRRP
jgi:hypothetical protein